MNTSAQHLRILLMILGLLTGALIVTMIWSGMGELQLDVFDAFRQDMRNIVMKFNKV